MTERNKPLISVVTVSYNAVAVIEQTILSVINQTYPHIEYIIIDGGSKDGTIEIIKKYENHIAYWISEPDKGIYDAMNKGITKATGVWINFMNSGDRFVDEHVIAKLILNIGQNVPDVIYGESLLDNGTTSYFPMKVRNLKEIWKGMCFCHQASFVRTALLQREPFDSTFSIAADFKTFFQFYQAGKWFQYIPMPICLYKVGGFSDNNPKAVREWMKIVLPAYKSLKYRVFFGYRWIKCVLKYNLCQRIGIANYDFLRKLKRDGLRLLQGERRQ